MIWGDRRGRVRGKQRHYGASEVCRRFYVELRFRRLER